MAEDKVRYNDSNAENGNLIENLLKRVTELEIREQQEKEEISKLNHHISLLQQIISSSQTEGHTTENPDNIVIDKTTLQSTVDKNIIECDERNTRGIQNEELPKITDEYIASDDIQPLSVRTTLLPINKENDNTKEEDSNTMSDSIVDQSVYDLHEEERHEITYENNAIDDKQALRKPDVKANDQYPKLATRGAYCNDNNENVIRDNNERKYLPHFDMWTSRANEEAFLARQSGLQCTGFKTVICVDTSASMSEGNGWIQTKLFVRDYLNGLEEFASKCNERVENVALSIFGNDTKVVQRFTNDYQNVLKTFNQLTPNGPSPTYGGLAMALAATDSAPCGIARVNGVDILTTKIVLITDGNATESSLYQGPDEVNQSIADDTNAQISIKLEEITRRQLDFFIVPVGNVNTTFLSLVTTVASGKLLQSSEGAAFSDRLSILAGMNSSGIADVSNLSAISSSGGRDEELTELKDRNSMDQLKNEHNFYHESNDKNIPSVGSRVIRGPDWKHDDADGEGPGTVIGHSSGSKVYVEWDFIANINEYRYSEKFGYDVLLTDQTRELTDGCGKKIAVGCLVQPGKDFNYAAVNVSPKEKGVVIKVLTPKEDMVLVRWKNFKRIRGEYSFGRNSIYEVELCIHMELDNGFCNDSKKKSKTIKMFKNKNI